jgi:hypothetical protein
LKGKTTRKTPEAVNGNLLPILRDFFEKYKMVSIAHDSMYINNIPSLVSISKNLRFATTQMMRELQNNTIINGIRQTPIVYNKRNSRFHSSLPTENSKVSRMIWLE